MGDFFADWLAPIILLLLTAVVVVVLVWGISSYGDTTAYRWVCHQTQVENTWTTSCGWETP